MNDEETIAGATFLAAPFFDRASAVSGAITIGIPKARLTDSLRAQMGERVVETCRRLSENLQELGYVTPRWNPLVPASPREGPRHLHTAHG